MPRSSPDPSTPRSTYSLRPRTRPRVEAPLRLTDLFDDVLEQCLPLQIADAARAAASCRALLRAWQRPSFARRLELPDTPMRADGALACLRRLADAGNPSARFRLGVARVYESSAAEAGEGYEEGLRLLKSLAEPPPEENLGALRGDALFEIWHLTKDGDERERLLRRAASEGHVASQIELHGTSKSHLQTLGLRRPLDVSGAASLVAVSLVAATVAASRRSEQHTLASPRPRASRLCLFPACASPRPGSPRLALTLTRAPPSPQVFSPAWLTASENILASPSAERDREEATASRHYCDRPGCVRWRFRKREVRKREAVGLTGSPYIRLWKCGRCRCACYCSKACQTLAWPRPHREECDRILGLHANALLAAGMDA